MRKVTQIENKIIRDSLDFQTKNGFDSYFDFLAEDLDDLKKASHNEGIQEAIKLIWSKRLDSKIHAAECVELLELMKKV